MPLDSAQFISELSIDDPPGTDPLNQGDDQIRTTKRATQQSFPNVDAAVPQTAAQMAQMAIKNEQNTFSQVNTFSVPGQRFTDLNVLKSDASDPAGFHYEDEFGQRRWTVNMGSVAAARAFQIRRRDTSGGLIEDSISIDVTTGRTTFVQNLILNDVGGSTEIGTNYQDTGVTRWQWQMAGATRNMRLRRFNSSEVLQDDPISIDEANGRVTFINETIFAATLRMEQATSDTQNMDIRYLQQSTTASRWRIRVTGTTYDMEFRRANSAGAFQSIPLKLQADGFIQLSLPTTNPGGSGLLWINPTASGFVAIT